MKIPRILLLNLFLFLLISFNAQSEENNPISFSQISLNEGLSQSTIFSIAQDKTGNMWFATYDGLNKFDGYSFTVYRHDYSDANSIASDIAKVLKIDSKGVLWIGTREGLSCYDEKRDNFKNYFYKSNMQVNAIGEVKEDMLILGTSKGVLFFDCKQQKFIRPANQKLAALTANYITKYNEKIYIGTDNGVMVCSPEGNNLQMLSPALAGKKVQCMLRQSDYKLWIATEGAGLYMLNLRTRQMKNYRREASNGKSLSSDYIRSLALDAQNRLWIGTFNELNLYNDQTDSFQAFRSNPVEEGSLSQNSVRSIFQDAQGGMWFGTYFGGLNYYHPLKNRFGHIKRIPFQNSLNDNVTSCIVEDRNGNLWIGANDGGLNFYNAKTKQYSNYSLKGGEGPGSGSNNVKAVWLDEKNGLVYIGTHAGGLSVLHYGSKQIDHYNMRNSGLQDENVYAIIPAQNGELWLGTLKGLARFNPAKRTITPVNSAYGGKSIANGSVTVLCRDSKNRLWVGGERGLNVYKTDRLIDFSYIISGDKQLREAFVNSIMQDKEGRVWISTRNGLFVYNDKTGKIKHYTTKNGLPNNVIYGVLEDSYGRMWISSNKGLSCLTPDNDTFRNYTQSDGIQSNQFNNYSFCRTRSGEMYFGGINGITVFRPELLIDNPYAPKVLINDLKVFGRSVHPGDDTGILDENICMAEGIKLKASQSSFSLDLVVFNYISGKHNTFAYKLEGYDKDWNYLTDGRTVFYSNLPSGNYVLKVKAANSDGKWNEAPTELKIRIMPVWYKSWWAIILFMAIAAGITMLVFRYLLMRKNMEAQLHLERMENDKQQELSQMKLRFFINMSHELRTPLTLIQAPLQELLSRINDKWARKQLEHIERNANRLLHMVNQLMDYRRAELGVLQLKAAERDLNETLQPIILLFDKIARRKKIEYIFQSEIEKKKMLFDPNYLEIIVNNLLSNAFKFTPEGGTISVKTEIEDNNLLISVSDTGIGIPEEKQKLIFERFYQADCEQFGTGIGLSLVKCLVELHHGTITLVSKKDCGSTFIISIPQNRDLYHPAELTRNEGEEAGYHSINQTESFFTDIEVSKAEVDEAETEEGKKRTVMVVEDNSEIQDFLNEGLSRHFNVLRASNGQEALEVMKNADVDLIITDVMMPVMDGIKLCRQVKRNLQTCHIPVIILSAKGNVEDQMEGLQVGADDYIPKPFSLSVMIAKINNMLHTRYMAIEHYSNSMEIAPEEVTFNVMDEELLKKAITVVQNNMDNIEFTTDEFARQMNMSRTNLHLKMKAITGEPTNEFIRKMRFNEAARLLKEGRYNVSEISMMVGFNTPSYFATSFKKYFGCLPSEYVKKGR
ncbi:hybrid sensor histidine kinase/response regulator transcription factor [Bacteroides sedimenti]|uniref:histidine kinase n=1 Tax=Bacteroides sedimenti TaxID=2136147 RepID=A0ABM8IA38_9BACE